LNAIQPTSGDPRGFPVGRTCARIADCRGDLPRHARRCPPNSTAARLERDVLGRSPSGRMPSTPRMLTRTLLVAMLGTAVVFVAAVTTTQIFARGIHRAASDITENASPSVAALAGTRTELRHLELLLDDYVDLREGHGAGSGDLRSVSGSREQL